MKILNKIRQAIKLLDAGNIDGAAKIASDILAKHPNSAEAQYVLGRVAYYKENLDLAADITLKAYANLPKTPNLTLELGNLLRLAGRDAEALDYLKRAATELNTFIAHREVGLAAFSSGAIDEAKQAFEIAHAIKPVDPLTTLKISQIYRLEENYSDALALQEKLINQQPKNPHNYAELIETYLVMAEPHKALDACERCLAMSPSYTRGLAYKCIALSEAGEEDALAYLFDTDKFLKRINVPAPDSFESIDSYNDTLADHILNRTLMLEDHPDYSTINGSHSRFGELFTGNQELGADAHRMIMRAIEEYKSIMPDDPDHPAVYSRPSEVQLISWAVVMRHQGHELTHIHPKMWVGGVYYVKLPSDFDSQPDPHAGHIEFGHGPDHFHPIRKPETLILKPSEGDFVIFPGYFWHRTIPLQSQENRICMAYDLQSAKGWGI